MKELSAQLTRDSYAVIPRLYAPEKLARLRSALEQIYRDLGEPPLFAKEPIWPQERIEIAATGLVIHQLLSFAPELHADLLEPAAIEILRGTLGPDMHLEFAGAVICNHTRPFFPWHNHLGGIDVEKFRRLGLRPEIERPERVAMIIYLDEMAPGTGQLLIYPRRLSGAAEPPHAIEDPDWEGRLTISGPPGTVAMIDQCTWHAVLPRTIDTELRFFVGMWFTAGNAPEAELADTSLLEVESPDPLMQTLLPRRPDAGPG